MKSAPQRPKASVAVLLSGLSGYVDTLGYLLLGKVLVAHMSGNTLHAALRGAQGGVCAAWPRLWPIAAFFVGVLVGRAFSEFARRLRVRRRLSLVLAVEALLLLAFAATYDARPEAAVGFAASAMGVQSAALRHVAGHRLRTTFVTGMLVALADELVEGFVFRRMGQRPSAALHAGVWLAFASGALAASVLWFRAHAVSLVPIAVVLSLVVVWDARFPLAPKG